MRTMLPCLSLLLPSVVNAGDELSLYQKLERADLVIEVRLPVSGDIPAAWPNMTYDPQGWAFPDQLRAQAMAKVETSRVVAGQPPETSFESHLFASPSPCWWAAHARGELRALVFFDQQDGVRQVFGVEQERGAYSDLNPQYEQLVVAVQRAAAWGEERMQAVSAATLWQDQRLALVSENPFERMLARDFLLAHESATTIDELWGAVGSQARLSNEAEAQWPDNPGWCE